MSVLEDFLEKRVTEEKKAFARRLIARGKQILEEIAEEYKSANNCQSGRI